MPAPTKDINKEHLKLFKEFQCVYQSDPWTEKQLEHWNRYKYTGQKLKWGVQVFWFKLKFIWSEDKIIYLMSASS